MAGADVDDSDLGGMLAQVDTFGEGVSALLAAATTPTRPNAPTLPSRPTRKVLDCAAYQSRIVSALVLKKTLRLSNGFTRDGAARCGDA